MLAPFPAAQQPDISLSPGVLPNYALRTTMRMLAALVASLVFTFTYGTLAAKSRRAEMVLIPLLDVLQSVPVLGYLSFTVVFFVSLSPEQGVRGGARRDFRDLHQPSLEYGVQLFPVLAHHSATISMRRAAVFASPAGSGSGALKCLSPCRAWSGTR